MKPAWTLPAPAKLNLFLHITGQRDNGYHDLETLFQLIDWGDELEFETSEQISVEQQPDLNIPEQENLAFRAAALLSEYCQSGQGIHIRLKKRTPAGAGLGGGSSDAATTLLALNQIWKLGLGINELSELGLQLGADVPVFIQGRTALGQGVGEKLTPVDMPENWFLVVTPKVHISTASIFSHPQLVRDTAPLVNQEPSLLASESSPLLTRDMSPSKMCALAVQGGQNDCQTVVEILHPEVANIRKTLEKLAPVRMSGTGSSLFAQCATQQDARQLLDKLVKEELGNHFCFIAKGVNQSPVHRMLAD